MSHREELAALVARAARAHPNIRVDAGAFAAWVSARLDPSEVSHREVHIEDLLIAYACCKGDRAALDVFEREFMPVVEASIARTGAETPELGQMLRIRLLVSDRGREARLSTYRGTGSLKGWLSVCAAREALMVLRSSSPADSLSANEGLVDVGDNDPELRLMKAQSVEAFELASAAALGELSDRDRNLLRYQVVDRLRGEEIAAIYRVHPSSVSRWLAQVRRTLRDTVRRELCQRLDVSTNRADSLIRLIESRIDISLHDALVGSVD